MLAGYILGVIIAGLSGFAFGAVWMAHMLGVKGITITITPSGRNPMEE